MPGRAGGWLALFLAGALSSLLLVHAGPGVGYQHYPPWPRLLAEGPSLPLLILAVQLVVVTAALVRSRATLTGLLRGVSGRARVLAAAALVLTSATLSRDPVVYAGELALASLIELAALGNLVLFAGALGAPALTAVGRVTQGLLGPAGEARIEPGGPDRLAWSLAAAVTLLAGVLAAFVYQRHPHVPDEVVYLFHARYFAAGRLWMPLPAVPEAFSVDLMSYEPARWFSPVPPGWPAILAIGARFGVPWLVDPILAGINILLSYTLLRELFPRRTARLGILLLACSPWQLFMAMNFMTHTATLTCALAAAVLVARMRRDPRLRWGLLAGVFVGLAGLIRPLDGLTVALLLGFWSLGARGRRFRFAPSAALTLATLAMSSLVLPYNRVLTGSARVFPLMRYTDLTYGPGTNAMGFGANRGLGWSGVDPLPGHGPLDVLINANFNLFQTNVELLGWATGSLLVLALWLGSGRLRRPDWLMNAVLAVVVGLHSLYWFSGGPDFGARYWYLILLPCVALSARGLEQLESLAEAKAPGAGRRILAAAGGLLAGTLLIFVPWRAADKYYHYRGMRPGIAALASARRFGPAVVLIRGRRFPDYASATLANPVDPRGDDALYAWDRGPAVRRQLVRAYPDRPFWIVNGPSVSGAGFAVAAGPLSGAELLQRADSLAPAP